MDTMYGTALYPNLNHPNELPDPDLNTIKPENPVLILKHVFDVSPLCK